MENAGGVSIAGDVMTQPADRLLAEVEPLDAAAAGTVATAVDQSPTSPTLSYIAPQDDHRTTRNTRLVWSVLTSLMTKPFAVVMPIITVRLFLRQLGTDRYGLYESIGSLAVWLGLTNAGMTLGLVNKLTDCHVSGDREMARRHVSSLAFLMLASTTVVLLLLTMIVPMVDWQRVFPSNSALGRAEVPYAVWTACAITVLGLLAGFPQAVYTGYQELHRNNLWDGVAKVLTLLACVGVVYFFRSAGLVVVIIAAAGSGVFVRLFNTLSLFLYEKPWLLPLPRYFDRRLLYGMVKQGIGLFVISSSALAIFQVDKIIIGHFLGADAVAQYSVVSRPFLIAFGIYTMLLGPLWPAHGEALRRGDVAWVRTAVFWSVTLGAGVVALCGVAMFFFGDHILRIWTGGNMIVVSRPLVVALTALFILWSGMSSLSVLLNSAGVLRAQMWFITSHAVLNLIVAVAMVKPFGVTGVAWSMTLTGLFTSVWGYPWMLRRYVLKRAWAAAPVDAGPLRG